MDIKEIKQEIRRLRKVKKDLRPGTAERLDIGRKIKALKQQLAEMNTPEPEKAKLIAEILARDILLKRLEINLNKFTIKELQKHLDRITKKDLPG